jgi:hypothetical protein
MTLRDDLVGRLVYDDELEVGERRSQAAPVSAHDVAVAVVLGPDLGLECLGPVCETRAL